MGRTLRLSEGRFGRIVLSDLVAEDRIEAHADLLEVARDDARLLLARDPELQFERGEAVRLLLYLFGRDEAVRLLRAG